MNLWLEIVQLASTICFLDEEDSLIWQFTSNGVYSSQSMYKVINFRGVLPMHIPAVWSLKIPLRVQFFLWLLSKNKLLTRDQSCLLCNELESVYHLKQL